MAHFSVPSPEDLSKFAAQISDSLMADLASRDVARAEAAAEELRSLLPSQFDIEYVKNVVIPALFTSWIVADRLVMPMIDAQLCTKQEALSYYLWGLLYDSGTPNMEAEGLTVFTQGYDRRGPDNLRKRIYFSALTSDLYRTAYEAKVGRFFERLFSADNAGQPLMRRYLDSYFDLYWDLHIGIRPEEIPDDVKRIGTAFNTVIASLAPTEEIFHTNYQLVRELRPSLKQWIERHVDEIAAGRSGSEQTFVHFWIKNGELSEHFRKIDVVFECFHNFVALSQWGHMLYRTIGLLRESGGSPEIRKAFQEAIAAGDDGDATKLGALDCFVMELFRTIAPNSSSLSSVGELVPPMYRRYAYLFTPHQESSTNPIHWKNPNDFDPGRYASAPLAHQNDEKRSAELGFAQCPFHKTEFKVKDGRDVTVANSIFGTVYGVEEGAPDAVCDYAGYAPFGFGYRRCPGEVFTIEVFKTLLRQVAASKVEFKTLELAQPEILPLAPLVFLPDNMCFVLPA